jgi:hypothetical protein
LPVVEWIAESSVGFEYGLNFLYDLFLLIRYK